MMGEAIDWWVSQHLQIAPVIIESRKLARTWLGKLWNANLERDAEKIRIAGRGFYVAVPKKRKAQRQQLRCPLEGRV